MKQIKLLLILLVCQVISLAQNVGVGTTTPTEKLDVNGNMNLSGQLKLNGNAGTANQMLMKDAANNLIWGDAGDYKNLRIFDCNGIAFSVGASNCVSGFTIPAGVTSILVECWGGGGGGGRFTGGSGGGYIAAKLTVTPGMNANIIIGAGGNFTNVVGDGIQGGNTSFSIDGITITAQGGGGGSRQDPTVTFNNLGRTSGGGFSSTVPTNYIGFTGSAGRISETSYTQVGSTEFGQLVKYGDGGDAGNAPGSGASGGRRLLSSSISQNVFAEQFPPLPGGGGGADFSGGFYGRGGRVIIRY